MATKFEFRPLMGTFERKFQNDAWNIIQRAMWASGIRIVAKPNEEIREALSQVGMLYKKRAVDEF